MPPPHETAPRALIGIVVSAGKMQRAIKVRIATQTYNSFLRKKFKTHTSHLTSDPASSARLGDVVRIENEGIQISKHIHHVLTQIITPWGPGIDERPPVMSKAERHAVWREGYVRKIERRTGRGVREGFELGWGRGRRGVVGRELAGEREGLGKEGGEKVEKEELGA